MVMNQHSTTSTNSNFDTPDQHGFVMMGAYTLFLDHLAMFAMANHRYHFIVRATLPSYAMSLYVADRAAHPGEVHILGNSQYDLLTLPEIHAAKLASFVADIFRGLPEDPNSTTPLIHNVNVSIYRVVYSRAFDNTFEYPSLQTYVLYGEGTEAHLSHFMDSRTGLSAVCRPGVGSEVASSTQPGKRGDDQLPDTTLSRQDALSESADRARLSGDATRTVRRGSICFDRR